MNEIAEYAKTTVHSLETIQHAALLLKDSPLPVLEALDIWVEMAAKYNVDLITLIRIQSGM